MNKYQHYVDVRGEVRWSPWTNLVKLLDKHRPCETLHVKLQQKEYIRVHLQYKKDLTIDIP